MVTIQKHHYISFLHSFGRFLFLIFLMVVSIGVASATLPSEAATTYTAPKVTAKSLNNANYQMTLSWTPGNNPSTTYWRYGYTAYHVTSYSHVTSNSVRSVTFSQLPCGHTYSFTVAVSTSTGTTESSNGAASAGLNCPSSVLNSVMASGNTVSASYTNASGFNTSYEVYYRAGSGSYASAKTSSTSFSFTGACATTYSVYVVPYGGSQHGANSVTKMATTAACPAPPPAPTPVKKPVSSPTPAPPTFPTPTGFAGTINSAKIINLSWQAVAGTAHYNLSRSVDAKNWTLLTSTAGTTYTDSNATYATTYYYELTAANAAGLTSAPAIAQVTTDTQPSLASKIRSNDGATVVQVPEGAINQDYVCSLTESAAAVAKAPTDQSILIGPYVLSCADASSKPITHFNKAVSGTMALTPQEVAHYRNMTVLTTAGKGWQGTQAHYDTKTRQLQFNLNDTTTLAAFGTPAKNNLPMILVIVAIVLLLIGSFFLPKLFKHRQARRTPAVAMATGDPTEREQFQQAVAAPECTHKALAQQVTPSGHGCMECEQTGSQWKGLRICLICGHVGCSDDSSGQHAKAHFETTGHPIIYEYNNPAGNSMGWCYIDKTYI